MAAILDWPAAPGSPGRGGSLARGDPGAIELSIVGGFTLRHEGRPVALPPSAERVVAYVALHDGPATRANIAGTLWLDANEERAQANLRSALWRLRRPGLAILDTTTEQVALSPRVVVDLHQLARYARGVLDGEAEVHEHIERLATGGDLLGDWYEDWVLLEREHFRQLRLQALERLTGVLAAAGRYGRATEAALAAIASEPLRESAHRALIAVHLAQGNQSEAIRQYCRYRRLIRDELDLEPSELMDALMGPLKPGPVDPPALMRT